MTRPSPAAMAIAVIALVCAAMLALPAQTITTAYINDVLIFLDGAQRIVMGQVPNRDFHTALGPLNYYLPALGLLVSGRMGGAMPVGMALLILVFLPIAVHVLTSRLRPVLAVAFGAFLILILAVPANLGNQLSSISFAMFYNRIGWAALGLLAVLYLRPERATAAWRDAFCAAALVLIALYTKITYAPVAFALLFLMLLDRSHRAWAFRAFGLTFVAMLLIEVVWRGSLAHLRDLLDTAQVSGGRGIAALIRASLDNLPDILVAGLLALMALYRTRRFLDVCFYGLCFAGGVLILSQNAHWWGIISMFGAAAVAAEQLVRSGRRPAVIGAALLFLVLVVPPIGKHTISLGTHTALSLSDWGTPLQLPAFEQVRFGYLRSGDGGFSERYVGTFAEGAELLRSLDTAPERVVVLDFSNPFTAGMNLAPPAGDWSWMHWGRNISTDHHLPPEQLFGGADIVMVPTIGINSRQLSELFLPWLEANFDLARQTGHWKLFRARGQS